MTKVIEIRIPDGISLDNFNDILFDFICNLNKLCELKYLDKEDINLIKKGFNIFESSLKPFLSYDLFKAIMDNDINKDVKKAIDCFFKLKQEEKTFMEKFNYD